MPLRQNPPSSQTTAAAGGAFSELRSLLLGQDTSVVPPTTAPPSAQTGAPFGELRQLLGGAAPRAQPPQTPEEILQAQAIEGLEAARAASRPDAAAPPQLPAPTEGIQPPAPAPPSPSLGQRALGFGLETAQRAVSEAHPLQQLPEPIGGWFRFAASKGLAGLGIVAESLNEASREALRRLPPIAALADFAKVMGPHIERLSRTPSGGRVVAAVSAKLAEPFEFRLPSFAGAGTSPPIRLRGPKGELDILDVLENAYAVVTKGAPFIFEEHEAANPSTAIQLAGTAAIFMGGGIATEFGILRSLGALGRAAEIRKMPRLRSTVDDLLRLYGQGEGQSLATRFFGAGFLGAKADLLWLTYMGVPPEDVLSNAALTGSFSFGLGATITGVGMGVRASRATIRATRALSEPLPGSLAERITREAGLAEASGATVASEINRVLRGRSDFASALEMPGGKPQFIHTLRAPDGSDVFVTQFGSKFGVARRRGSEVEILDTTFDTADEALGFARTLAPDATELPAGSAEAAEAAARPAEAPTPAPIAEALSSDDVLRYALARNFTQREAAERLRALGYTLPEGVTFPNVPAPPAVPAGQLRPFADFLERRAHRTASQVAEAQTQAIDSFLNVGGGPFNAGANQLEEALRPRFVQAFPRQDGSEMVVFSVGDTFTVARRGAGGTTMIVQDGIASLDEASSLARRGTAGLSSAERAEIFYMAHNITDDDDPAAFVTREALLSVLDKTARNEPLSEVEFEILLGYRAVKREAAEAVEFTRGTGREVTPEEEGVIPFTNTGLRATEPPAGDAPPPRDPDDPSAPRTGGGDGGGGDGPRPSVEDLAERQLLTVAPRFQLSFADRLRNTLESWTERFKDNFVYEWRVRGFESVARTPDGQPIAGMSFADDLRAHKAQREYARRLALRDLRFVFEPLSPLGRKIKGEEYGKLVDIIVYSDLKEVAERGLPTGQLTHQEILGILARRKASARPETLEAASRYWKITNEMRAELIRRGKLTIGAGYDFWYPHKVVQDYAEWAYEQLTGRTLSTVHPTLAALGSTIQTPRRGYTLPRHGTTKPIDGDLLEVLEAALVGFHVDNAVDDFLEAVEKTHALTRTELRARLIDSGMTSDAADRRLDVLTQTGRVRIFDVTDPAKPRLAEEWQEFHPQGPTYFMTNVMDDATRQLVEDALTKGERIAPEDMPRIREMLALGRPKTLILPGPIADRLRNFYMPRPRSGALRGATSVWKGGVTRWGGMTFQMLNFIGDAVNLARSNPAAYFNLKKLLTEGKFESSVIRAFRTIFAHYRTPILSPQQFVGAVLGGASGEFMARELTEDDPSFTERAGAILTAAGLGYIASTRGIRIGGKTLIPPKIGTAPEIKTLANLYEEADRLGAINSGFVYSQEELGRYVFGQEAIRVDAGGFATRQARDGLTRAWDTIVSLIQGKVTGDPFNVAGLRAIEETLDVVMGERENLLRFASYIQMIEDGVPGALAAKRANEALVDYLRFTDFENRTLRGFLLPFWSFSRHNIANWTLGMLGRDVGGKAKIALAATASIFAFDIAAQAWNERFFPDVERTLDPDIREGFHVIMGNPMTGEVYRDKRGRPLYIGHEMPYEMALEFFGFARPGVIYSELFGMGINGRQSLVARAKAIEEAKDAPKLALVTLDRMRERFMGLLTPFLKVPLEFVSNRNMFFDTPITPERYVGTKVEYERWLTYVAETAFRQFREVRRAAREIRQGRFNPAASPFGLGLPIRSADMNREVQGRIHELIDEVSRDPRERRAAWMSQIDDVIYSRRDLTKRGDGEFDRVREIIHGSVESGAVVTGGILDPREQERAWRYYIRRADLSSVLRRWESLSLEQRALLWQRLEREPGMAEALIYYVGGGTNIAEGATPFSLPAGQDTAAGATR